MVITIEILLRVLLLFCGEGNGTPLQYSCPENPMDGGAWWAAVHGVTQSQTRLSMHTQDTTLGFPCSSVVKNPPFSAGDGFDPWFRRISNTSEQLSPCATTFEPVL